MGQTVQLFIYEVKNGNLESPCYKQGGIHESYLNHSGRVFLCSKLFSGTQGIGAFFNCTYFLGSQGLDEIQHCSRV